MSSLINIANLSQFLKSVDEARAAVGDLTVPLTEIGKQWMRTNEIYFKQSPGSYADLNNGESQVHVRGYGEKKTGERGGMVGGYKKAKLKKWGFVYPMLVASGRLRNSLTQYGNEDSLFQIMGGSVLLLGTRVQSKSGADYPRFLNEGTRFMPARPFMNVSEITLAGWKKVLRNYVLTAVGPSGTPAGGKAKANQAAKESASQLRTSPQFQAGKAASGTRKASTERRKSEAEKRTTGRGSSSSGGGSSKKKKRIV